jgi:hypothetical protein
MSGRKRQQAAGRFQVRQDSETKLTNKAQSNKNSSGAKATFGLKCKTPVKT